MNGSPSWHFEVDIEPLYYWPVRFCAGAGSRDLAPRRGSVSTRIFWPRAVQPSTLEIRRSLRRFVELTESLDRGQRVRVDRVVFDWEESLFCPPRLRRRRSRWRRGLDALLGWGKREQELDLNVYLATAHEHEAVARGSAKDGIRRWFADWQEHAIAALRLGLSPETLLELLRSVPGAAPPRANRLRPLRHRDPDLRRFRERLENVIFPNAPGVGRSLEHLATGDGLVAAPI